MKGSAAWKFLSRDAKKTDGRGNRSDRAPVIESSASCNDHGGRMNEDAKWLIERQIPHMRRYAFALLRDRDLADDIVQDSLERALHKRHLLKHPERIRGWLFRIVYRQCLDHFRRPARAVVPADEDTLDGAAHQIATAEDRLVALDIFEAIDRLPPNQRAVVLLVALEGLNYAEVAAVIDVPVGTVRSRLSRARETLREIRDGGETASEKPRLRVVQ